MACLTGFWVVVVVVVVVDVGANDVALLVVVVVDEPNRCLFVIGLFAGGKVALVVEMTPDKVEADVASASSRKVRAELDKGGGGKLETSNAADLPAN